MAIKKNLVSAYAGGRPTAASTPTPTPATKTNEDIATEVIAGQWGNGADRKNQLTSAGYDYAAVQQIVDSRLGGSSAATTPAATTPTAPESAAPATPAPEIGAGAALAAQWKEQMPNADADALASQWKENVPALDKAKADQLALLDRWQAGALEQSKNQIDYGVTQGVTDLERALADAQPQFKEQQESVTRDEMQARDNSALYAEARGDKGGIGQEQYNSIMNTAAQNRLSVQQAQTKLSTDTQRQIADLRAQGEFDKADKALEISQQYLSQLIGLEQWAFEAGMTTAQFQASLDQWAAEYNMAMAQFSTGLDQWAAEFDYTKEQNELDRLANSANALINAGIGNLTEDQLKAAGFTAEQAASLVQMVKDQQAAAALSSAWQGGDVTGGDVTGGDIYDRMNAAGVTAERAYAYLIDNGYSDTEASNIVRTYKSLLNGGAFDSGDPTGGVVPAPEPTSKPADYGTSYTTAWSRARRMHDEGKSDEEILSYLDTFTTGRLTDAGYKYIMESLDLGGYRTGVK